MYTGNTSHANFFRGIFSVYPCVYREHTTVMPKQHFQPGLSLCIQGTLYIFSTVLVVHRFIPVYTGNTMNMRTRICAKPVYPCVYREHHYPIQYNGGDLRFIPVYTGNTGTVTIRRNDLPVYPCVYREHIKRQF